MRLTGWARAFDATSPATPGRSATPRANRPGWASRWAAARRVFNFFRPGYAPPATAIAAPGLVAPEFQITNEQSVVGYINYMYALVANGTGDVKADYTAILTKATDSAALVDEVNLCSPPASCPPRPSPRSGPRSTASIATATNGPDQPGRHRHPADAGVARLSDG